MGSMKETKNDFTKGSVASNILRMAIPMTIAQIVNVLYNIVDRMFIGRLPGEGMLALTGLGLTFPVISIVTAFANLCGSGGAPLCSIARGEGDHEQAETIMGNAFTMLLTLGVLLTGVVLAVKEPVLYAFGASTETFPYADAYLSIYALGSIFVMTGLGMNAFINSQGFGKFGMVTVCLGAATNILLDPIFIYVLHMGVQGAALATILSQFVSAVWVLRFLTGRRAILKLRLRCMRLQWKIVRRIVALGLSNFTMACTNSAVQVMCNSTLQFFGGDLYVAIMTVINSIREVIFMPISGTTQGSLPVMGYNYGARDYARVRQCIKFITKLCVVYASLACVFLLSFPEVMIRIFNDDPALVSAGARCVRIYSCCYFMMSLQMAGQNTFLALGRSKQAIFFSLLRKAIIVVPLVYILPRIGGLGVDGVFLSEPISDIIGGTACFATMMCTVWRELKAKEKEMREEKSAESAPRLSANS